MNTKPDYITEMWSKELYRKLYEREGLMEGRYTDDHRPEEEEKPKSAINEMEIEDGREYIDNPPHYTRGKIECIDYIEDQKLDFLLGNVVKYISRAGYKETTDKLTDLRKARWYLDRYITNGEKLLSEIFGREASLKEFSLSKDDLGACTEDIN